jgi:hypothetical protein
MDAQLPRDPQAIRDKLSRLMAGLNQDMSVLRHVSRPGGRIYYNRILMRTCK